MKKLLLILLLISTPALAKPKFQHIEAMPTGWQFIYMDKQNPRVIFVPKCTATKVDDCGWNKTSSRALADQKVNTPATKKHDPACPKGSGLCKEP